MRQPPPDNPSWLSVLRDVLNSEGRTRRAALLLLVLMVGLALVVSVLLVGLLILNKTTGGIALAVTMLCAGCALRRSNKHKPPSAPKDRDDYLQLG